MVKASETGGVKPMSIAGRFINERERLLGMTAAERDFRKQWLKDQELSHSEPKNVPEMYKATHNPIRRLYRFPLDTLGKMLEPVLGLQSAARVRYFTGKFILAVAGAYALTYYVKYNTNDWTRKNGMRILKSNISVHEGDPGYPRVSQRSKPSDYGDRGFNDNKLNL
ncbi:uncharacterized protein LOC126883390 [Diabrotica virgifera virgifera]|uniref:Uncharacterized protein LOC114343229 n=2 Tax=Diabrotica virgifera virgifera TaxID=50390 RepID=A0A6P7H1B0_DIAVI|nr:uncharacterized protein LOC126883390 [Diabrotica virgifera virgifera]